MEGTGGQLEAVLEGGGELLAARMRRQCTEGAAEGEGPHRARMRWRRLAWDGEDPRLRVWG